jgi:cation diffusion facilitator family transporter
MPSITPVKRMAWLSIGAALLTITLKFSAWRLTDSVGLFSDAAESSVNLVAAVMALLALTVAERQADPGHPFGHAKAEYLASGAEGGLILLAGMLIIYSALERILTPVALAALGPGMLVALLAAGVNFAVARLMLTVAHRYDSIVIEADAKHLLTDVWTSLAVVAGLLIVYLAPGWQRLDPLIAIAVALHIMLTGVGLVRRSLAGLMDASLPQAELTLIETTIRRHTGADAVFHNLRTRKAGTQRFIEFHLLVAGTTTVQAAHEVCESIEQQIKALLANTQITIHIEPLEDPASWDALPTLERPPGVSQTDQASRSRNPSPE